MNPIEILGQPKASLQANLWLSSLSRGGVLPPAFVHGPAGTGKSFLAKAMQACGIADIEWITFDSAIEIGRTQAAFTASGLVDLMSDTTTRKVIVIDEAQGITKSCSGVRSAWEQALYPFGNGLPDSTPFNFSAEAAQKGLRWNWATTHLVLLTNTPEAMEPAESKKLKQAPFRRRMHNIELTNYSSSDIGEVIAAFFAHRKIRIHESAAGIISRFHRGNLEALSDVFSKWKMAHPEKTTISKEEVIEAAKATSWLPRGLKTSEARLMETLELASGKLLRRQLTSLHENAGDAIAHLQTMQTNGAHTPFITEHGTFVVLNEIAMKYLAACRKEGFTW